jgi:hypothetical protein
MSMLLTDPWKEKNRLVVYLDLVSYLPVILIPLRADGGGVTRTKSKNPHTFTAQCYIFGVQNRTLNGL